MVGKQLLLLLRWHDTGPAKFQSGGGRLVEVFWRRRRWVEFGFCLFIISIWGLRKSFPEDQSRTVDRTLLLKGGNGKHAQILRSGNDCRLKFMKLKSPGTCYVIEDSSCELWVLGWKLWENLREWRRDEQRYNGRGLPLYESDIDWAKRGGGAASEWRVEKRRWVV